MPAVLLFGNDFVDQSEIRPFLRSFYRLVNKKIDADNESNERFSRRKKKKRTRSKIHISMKTLSESKVPLCNMENGEVFPDENSNSIEDNPACLNNANGASLFNGKLRKIGKSYMRKKTLRRKRSISNKDIERMDICKEDVDAAISRNYDEPDVINKTCKRKKLMKRTRKLKKSNCVEVDNVIVEEEPTCRKKTKTSHRIGESGANADILEKCSADDMYPNDSENESVNEEKYCVTAVDSILQANPVLNRHRLVNTKTLGRGDDGNNSNFQHNSIHSRQYGIGNNYESCDIKYKISEQQKQCNAICDVPEYVALDCEFVGVGEKKTNALGRCSVVNYNGKILYDVYVKPEKKITDYRTRWSGIRPTDMVRAIPLDIAQEELKTIIKGKVIVGHAVYNDFKVLGVQHPPEDVRDTSTCKELLDLARVNDRRAASLKTLSRALLGRTIQKGEHCSVEDARATMDVFKIVQSNWEEMLAAKTLRRKQRKADNTDNELSTSYLSDEFWSRHLYNSN